MDPQARTARAEAGVTLGDLDRETQVFGLATPLGVVTKTGIAGLTLNGGIGYLRRKHGLSSDNLLSVDVMTADKAHGLNPGAKPGLCGKGVVLGGRWL